VKQAQERVLSRDEHRRLSKYYGRQYRFLRDGQELFVSGDLKGLRKAERNPRLALADPLSVATALIAPVAFGGAGGVLGGVWQPSVSSEMGVRNGALYGMAAGIAISLALFGPDYIRSLKAYKPVRELLRGLHNQDFGPANRPGFVKFEGNDVHLPVLAYHIAGRKELTGKQKTSNHRLYLKLLRTLKTLERHHESEIKKIGAANSH